MIKRTTLLFMCCWLSLGLMAEDIITLTSSQQVSCTIVETSETTIKYVTNDGFFELPISDVRSVKYSNGKEQVFHAVPATSNSPAASLPSSSEYVPYHAGATTPATTSDDGYAQPISTLNGGYAQPITSSGTAQPVNPYASQTTEKPRWKDEELSSIPKHEIVKEHSVYYMDDKIMSSQLYMRFLQKNCPQAYKQARSYGAFFGTGIAFLSAGGALTLLGGLYWGLSQSSIDYAKSRKSYDPTSSSIKADKELIHVGKILVGVGLPLFVSGGLLMCIGIPWSSKSHVTYNRSIESQNTTAMQQQPPMRLNLISHGNDIGLALQF